MLPLGRDTPFLVLPVHKHHLNPAEEGRQSFHGPEGELEAFVDGRSDHHNQDGGMRRDKSVGRSIDQLVKVFMLCSRIFTYPARATAVYAVWE